MEKDTYYKKTFTKISENKQKKIIDAAIKEFSSKGYNAANINTIAKNANISIGSMYSYFPSKEALFLTIVDTGYELLQKALNEVVTRPGTIFDKFEHMLRVSINYSKAYPHLNQIYLEISTEGLSHLATQLSLKMEKITTVTYEALLTQAKKSGEIRNDVQQQVLAFCVDNIAMMLQFSYASKYYNERMHLFLSPEYAQDEELLIKALVDIFRRGLTT